MMVAIESQNGYDYQLKMTITNEDGTNEILEHLFEPMIVSMYHCLAKESNKLLGTNFGYDESVIDSCAKAIATKYLHYGYYWILGNNRDNTIFKPQSRYISCGFNSGTIYDLKWTKEQVIAFIRALGHYLDTYDIHKMAYEGEKRGWLYHFNMRIGSTILNYYKDMCEADEEMRGFQVKYRKI
jgi:hypothetical protein